MKLSTRFVFSWLMAGCALLGATVSDLDAPNLNKAGDPFPDVSLPNRASGKALETLLGLQLPSVARWYGHTEADFRELLGREAGLHADRKGHSVGIDE